MKITAQLSGVSSPLSVEFRLINFFSCDLDSQEEHDTSPSRQLLSKRSDFCSAEELVQCSPFGGVEIGKRFLRVACGEIEPGAIIPFTARLKSTASIPGTRTAIPQLSTAMT